MAILEAVFANKAGQTPQEVERRRKYAQALIDASTSTEPVRSPWQAAARVLQGFMGGVEEKGAERADKEGRASANKSLIDALYGSSQSSGFNPSSAQTSMQPTQSTQPVNMNGNEVYSGFMDTVKAGGVQNPYALAAIAATGKAESGFDPGNVNRTWSDPSQSGQPGTAGGIMSWRGPRYQALAATGDLSPQGQAKFFLQEDPQLIQALNNAESVEEAQRLINNAWKFAGYDQPGGEAGRRLSLAKGFLPKFQGQGREVASLDPSIGMPGAAVEMQRSAPSFPGKQADDRMAAPGVPPMSAPQNVATPPVPPGSNQPVGIPAEFAGSPQLAGAQGGIVPALMGGSPASPQQIAQARALGASQSAPVDGNRRMIAQLLSNPYTAEVGQQMLMQEMQRRQEMNDPIKRLQLEKGQLELEQMRNPGPDYDMITGKDGSIFRADKRTGNIEQVYGGKPDKFRTLTDAEEQQMGLDPSKAYQIGADNKVDQIGGGGTTVNIDQKAEGAFDKKLAEKQAETFDTMATEGMNARADLGVINELEGLLQGRQGGTLTGLAGIAAKYGIGGEGMGDLQAAQALINKLVPTQRAPGSGSMSDRDVELFSRSLPSLWNTPGGNEKIINVMRGLAQYKQAQGEIADQVITGDMSRQEARRALRALPNPLADFKAPDKKPEPAENPLPPTPGANGEPDFSKMSDEELQRFIDGK